jgi:hypothetical protein
MYINTLLNDDAKKFPASIKVCPHYGNHPAGRHWISIAIDGDMFDTYRYWTEEDRDTDMRMLEENFEVTGF